MQLLNVFTDTRTCWTTQRIAQRALNAEDAAAMKKVERLIHEQNLDFKQLDESTLADEHERPAKQLVRHQVVERARKKRHSVLFATLRTFEQQTVLCANDGRGVRRWIGLPSDVDSITVNAALDILLQTEARDTVVLPSGTLVPFVRELTREWAGNVRKFGENKLRVALEIYHHGRNDLHANVNPEQMLEPTEHMTHLDRLEAESIHIIREVIAQADNPVMLYSVGKDSAVMLHLARKAFYPSPPPFPLLHVDTRWKFQAMYDFRDYMAAESGMDLLVHINPEGVEKNINPLDHGSALHTDIMKTQGLKQALDHYKFDVAFGGARRDEEKSRAKERVFSFRTAAHRWDAKNQRPELWNQYNGRKHPNESIRVFPISNWTELDIWQYIYREQIPIVPLYFAAERPVVERDGMLLMVDDDRLKLYPNEEIKMKKVRFRTLGCYPLTGAIESEADDLASIVLELLNAKTSERQGRAIDSDSNASMEKKKEEGYF